MHVQLFDAVWGQRTCNVSIINNGDDELIAVENTRRHACLFSGMHLWTRPLNNSCMS